MMKRTKKYLTAAIFALAILGTAGCGSKTEDPGAPPQEVIQPVSDSSGDTDSAVGNAGTEGGSAYEGEILEGAVSVRIGNDGQTEFPVDMYNNDAAVTMLDYLSDSSLLFPTYTYEEEQGFVAQSVRGTYGRDDEVTVEEIRAGELYLLSGGQLRLYFKDVEGAGIEATPIGYFQDAENLTELVQEAHEANLEDTWGVEVYFWITKTIE